MNDLADGNHGVLLGNASYGAGRVGQAFVFDGNGDGVLVGNPTNLQLQDFTIEAWIKRASISAVSFGSFGNGVIFGYGQNGYGLYLDPSGTPALSRIGIDAVQPGTTITDTNFHHLAVTKSGSSVVFYVDGLAYSAPAFNPGFVFSTPAAIGVRGDNLDNAFLGRIDEVAVFNGALSPAEIQAIYNAAGAGICTGPVAPVIIVQPTNQTVFVSESATFAVVALGTPPLAYQWAFKGTNISGGTNSTLTMTNVQFTNAGGYAAVVTNLYGSATSSNAVLTVNSPPPCVSSPTGLISWWRAEGNANDAVTGNHGTVQNGASYSPGKAGQAFNFNGINQYVEVSNSPTLNPGGSCSIEAWILPKQDGDQVILAKWGDSGDFANNRSYHLSVIPNEGLRFSISDAANQGNGPLHLFDVTGVVTLDAWNHVAGVYDQTTGVRRMYVNGLKVAERTNTPMTVFNGISKVGIGVRFPSSSTIAVPFNGLIDEVSLYGRALSANEIQAIYNASVSGKCVVPVPPTIIFHPRNTNVSAGANATLSVVVGGTVPFSYQWRYNGTNLVNANSSALTLTNVQFSQAGNYSVQITNIAGSVLSSNASLTVTFPPATLQAVNTNAMAGGPVIVPIVLVANGNENSLGFSINFSTMRLAYKRIMLGSGASGAALVVYTNQVNLGRLGVVAAFPGAATFPAGTQEVIKVIFDSSVLLGASSVPTTVSFGDQPISRQLSDAQFQTLPANYVSGTVTLLPTAYEGDVAPRPNGNQSYANADWLQAGRFAARLDIPTAGSEFQRADSAPRATLGDAQIKVTDWVQAGRYSLGSDPLTLAGGPTSEVASPTTPVPGARQVRVVNASALQGLTVTIPVNLEAQGDENALGFSVAFDSAQFNYSGASLGGAASGATLNLNTNQVASGRLGVVLALPIGNSFVAGTREIVKVNLTAKSFAGINSSVGFSDQLVPRAVSDALGNELPSDYIAANAIVNGVPPLSITRSGSNVTLAWPTWAASFNLQSSSNLLSAGSWTNVIANAQTNGPDLVVTLPIVEDTKFFRLQNP